MLPFWLSPLVIIAIVLGAYYGTRHDGSNSSSSSSSGGGGGNPSGGAPPRFNATGIANGTFPFPEPCTGYCNAFHATSIVIAPNGTFFKFSAYHGLHTAYSNNGIGGPWVEGPPLFADLPPLGKFPTGDNKLWAPDVHYINGLYYLYYTVYSKNAIGNHNLMDIGVATAQEPFGPYTDYGSVGMPYVANHEYSIIGSSLILTDPPFMSFGSYAWGIFGTEMENPPLKIAHSNGPQDSGAHSKHQTPTPSGSGQSSTVQGFLEARAASTVDSSPSTFRIKRRATPTVTAAPSSVPYKTAPFNPKDPYHTSVPGHIMYSQKDTNVTMLVADQPIIVGKRTNRTEGGFQFQWPINNGLFYLFYARGNCCPGALAPLAEYYRIEMCRAPHPSGPFVDMDGISCTSGKGGTVLLATHDNILAPGGVGVYNDVNKGPVMYYDYYDLNIGLSVDLLQFGWNQLAFNSSDGWPKVIGPSTQQRMAT